jgi:Sec-independent protein translocase protein TatA
MSFGSSWSLGLLLVVLSVVVLIFETDKLTHDDDDMA